METPLENDFLHKHKKTNVRSTKKTIKGRMVDAIKMIIKTSWKHQMKTTSCHKHKKQMCAAPKKQ